MGEACVREGEVYPIKKFHDNQIGSTCLVCKRCLTELKHKSVSQLCLGCYNKSQRTMERPPREELLNEIKELGFSEVGRKYGVSDNAIRKWCKAEGLPHTIRELNNLQI